LHWSSGAVTEHRITRPVHTWEQMADAPAVWERVQAGRSAGRTARRMAEELNAAGYRTPHGRPFTAESVRQLLSRGGVRGAGGAARPARCESHQPAEGAVDP